MDVVPYAISAAGNLIVLADGPELLVYSGSNDQGLWKLMAEDILMGVGATKERVYTIDAVGTLFVYRALDGKELGRRSLDIAPFSLAVSPEGGCAVPTPSALVVVPPGVEPITVPLESPRQLAWGPGGASLGVGSADGTFTAVDPNSGGAWGSVSVGGRITGVSWCASEGGCWAVAHDDRVSFVSGDGTTVLRTMLVGAMVGEVTVSEDGSVLAVVSEETRVDVFELATRTAVGQVVYDRPIHHIQFGNAHWLGVGFDDGDANRLDVVTGTMTRTQAHPGRAQNAWAMNVQINHALLRGAVASIAAGGADIARHNKPKGQKLSSRKKRGWIKWVVGGFALVLVGSLCCGVGSAVAAWFGGLFG